MVDADGATVIVGGGSWGTALAIHLAGLGRRVRLWMREPDLVRRMSERRDNPVYLPGIRVPEAVTVGSDLAGMLPDAELVIAVVPSPFARQVYETMASALPDGARVVVATKGIEERSLALPVEVAREVLGSTRPTAALSGPCFAAEVARGVPTAAVVACEDRDLARWFQSRLSGNQLRLYTNRDIRGVQLAGALKNVIAIAAGVVDGLELGHNTLAALITRGLAEITRLGVTLGGSAATFGGLAGMGDLVLTCTGDLSRNRRTGHALGRGERLGDVLARTRYVVEGVGTTRSARRLARRAGVDMPIVEEMYRILFGDAPAREAVGRLMGRPLTSEDGGGP